MTLAVKEETKRYNISSNALKDITKLLNGKYDTSQDIKLRDFTPKILVNYGIKDLPMLMNSTHILANILTKEEAKELNNYNKDVNYHGLGVKQFLNTINLIDNPIAIYENKNCKDYIILTNQTNDYKEKIIVAIYIETKGNYNNIRTDTNKIKSLYGKNKFNEYIQRKIKMGDFIKIYNIKKQVNTTGSQSSNDINLFV